MTHVPIDDLSHYVRNVLAVLSLRDPKDRATLLALRGDLGAGKTTFVQALAKELGIRDTVTSPTYVLMKAYAVHASPPSPSGAGRFERLVHIDAYRLERPAEFAALRPEEFLNDSRALVVVEWPERAAEHLPEPDLTLFFSAAGLPPGERDIEMQTKEEE